MSVNRLKKHVLILLEDDANRQIVNGFLNNSGVCHRCVQALPECGGWLKVEREFPAEYVPRMRSNAECFLILLFDSDRKEDRVAKVWEKVPEDVRERVFILSCLDEPEELADSWPWRSRFLPDGDHFLPPGSE